MTNDVARCPENAAQDEFIIGAFHQCANQSVAHGRNKNENDGEGGRAHLIAFPEKFKCCAKPSGILVIL